jgi:hypothetical protein
LSQEFDNYHLFSVQILKPRKRVLVSFARNGSSHAPSFPRRREATAQVIENVPTTDWIPAFAGMTGVSKGIPIPNDTSTRKRIQLADTIPSADSG